MREFHRGEARAAAERAAGREAEGAAAAERAVRAVVRIPVPFAFD